MHSPGQRSAGPHFCSEDSVEIDLGDRVYLGAKSSALLSGCDSILDGAASTPDLEHLGGKDLRQDWPDRFETGCPQLSDDRYTKQRMRRQ